MKFDLDSILATFGSQTAVGLLLGNWWADDAPAFATRAFPSETARGVLMDGSLQQRRARHR